jgi:hypothetical protein
MLLTAHQPQYLPYPGLLAKIDVADLLVVQDDLQYVKQEWQNRNRIRTGSGWRWLTVPVHATAASEIRNVKPVGNWAAHHRRVVEMHYGPARAKSLDGLWTCLDAREHDNLAEINTASLSVLLNRCGISTPMVLQSSLDLPRFPPKSANQRLVTLCRLLGCDSYLTGMQALEYIDPAIWAAADISLFLLKWSPTAYPQIYPGWIENMSSIDLMMCMDDPLAKLESDRRVVRMTAGLTR